MLFRSEFLYQYSNLGLTLAGETWIIPWDDGGLGDHHLGRGQRARQLGDDLAQRRRRR